MKVENMTSSRGNKVANQFIITDAPDPFSGNGVQYFQSHNTIIVKRDKFRAGVERRRVWLDRDKWDYSVTTSRYRNQFLGETTRETQKKIDSGEYILADLN